VGAGMPIGFAILLIFKGIKVFFRHFKFPPSYLGAKKNPTPDKIRGGMIIHSTVPPCLQQKLLPLIVL
jgi:hypothetical protein